METSGIYELKDAPTIPGLVFRAYRGPEDLAGMAAVHAGSKEQDKIDPLSSRDYLPTLEDLRRDFANLTPGNPNLLLIEINGQTVGYNKLDWWTEAKDGRVYLHSGWLLPGWRGKGIGRAAWHWSQDRARKLAAEQGLTAKAVLAANSSTTEPEKETLAINEGYTLVRNLSDMKFEDFARLEVLAATLPSGIEVRPVEPDHFPAIYTALKEARLGMFGEGPINEEDYQSFLNHAVRTDRFTPELWRVAWAGDKVVSFVINYPHPLGSGVVDEVATRPGWQRRGISRALMVQSLRELGRRGFSEVRLFTTAGDEKGARSLYEQLGFREVKQHHLFRKPLWD